MTAEQAMQAPAITLREDASVQEAENLFRAREIGHLPVIGIEGTLVGLVSERDLLRLQVRPPRNLAPGEIPALPVREFMVTPALAVGPSTEMQQVAYLMLERKADCLPVVDAGGAVLGVITRTDILRGSAKHPALRLWA
jgi:acetoin utilization protein AcuB